MVRRLMSWFVMTLLASVIFAETGILVVQVSDTADRPLVRVEPLDVGAYGVFAQTAGAHHNADSIPWELSKLAVAAGSRWETGTSVLFEAPEDRQLKRAVDGHGLGDPVVAHRCTHPVSR